MAEEFLEVVELVMDVLVDLETLPEAELRYSVVAFEGKHPPQ